MLKIDKKDYNDVDVYYIGYVTVKKIDNCNNIKSVNPLYLMIDEMIIRSIFSKDNKFYPQLFLDDALYEL